MASEFSTMTLENALEDLSSRFIVNLPQEELESEERVCFQIEQACVVVRGSRCAQN